LREKSEWLCEWRFFVAIRFIDMKAFILKVDGFDPGHDGNSQIESGNAFSD
jgi:hypothetical protein